MLQVVVFYKCRPLKNYESGSLLKLGRNELVRNTPEKNKPQKKIAFFSHAEEGQSATQSVTLEVNLKLGLYRVSLEILLGR